MDSDVRMFENARLHNWNVVPQCIDNVDRSHFERLGLGVLEYSRIDKSLDFTSDVIDR